MKHSQKAKYIVSSCMLIVGVFSAFIVFKNIRPSRGLPYEKVTMEQAYEYMEYEGDYLLLDISDPESFHQKHIQGALNIPYGQLVERIGFEVTDKSRIIYICGSDASLCAKAAMKLNQMGYTGITEIGEIRDWPGEFETEEE